MYKRASCIALFLAASPPPRASATVVYALKEARCVTGGVEIRWRTQVEDDTNGFAVFRGPTSSITRVTAIAAFVDAHGAGLLYSLMDLAPSATDRWYEVVEVTSNGLGPATPPVNPDEAPLDQGNVIHATKEGADVRLEFHGAGATAFRIYRDATGAAVGTTFLTTDTSQFWLDPVAVSDPQSWYYALRGVSCTGVEGP